MDEWAEILDHRRREGLIRLQGPAGAIIGCGTGGYRFSIGPGLVAGSLDESDARVSIRLQGRLPAGRYESLAFCCQEKGMITVEGMYIPPKDRSGDHGTIEATALEF